MNTDTCVPTETTSASALTLASAEKSDRRTDLCAIPMNIPWALLTECQAAAVLAVSVKALRRLRYEGGGPKYVKVNGCTVRYKVGDLQQFLAAQPTGGGTAPAGEERRGPGRPKTRG